MADLKSANNVYMVMTFSSLRCQSGVLQEIRRHGKYGQGSRVLWGQVRNNCRNFCRKSCTRSGAHFSGSADFNYLVHELSGWPGFGFYLHILLVWPWFGLHLLKLSGLGYWENIDEIWCDIENRLKTYLVLFSRYARRFIQKMIWDNIDKKRCSKKKNDFGKK